MRTVRALLVGMLVVAMTIGCGREGDGTFFKRARRIAVVPGATAPACWLSVRDGASKAAAEEKVRIIWVAPESADASAQVAAVQKALSRGPHALLVTSAEAGDSARELGGLRIVLADTVSATGDAGYLVAEDGLELGRVGAVALGGIMEVRGKVALLRYDQGDPRTPQREEGFLTQMGLQHADIEIASADLYAGTTEESALSRAQELLTACGDSLKGVFCPNTVTTVAMLKALEDAGRAGQVILVGCGIDPRLAEGMRRGAVHALVITDPFDLGYQGVKATVRALDGKDVGARVFARTLLVLPDTLRQPEVARLFESGAEDSGS